jgi:hypothetical protein
VHRMGCFSDEILGCIDMTVYIHTLRWWVRQPWKSRTYMRKSKQEKYWGTTLGTTFRKELMGIICFLIKQEG